jgi:hypothetical protein
MILVWKFTVCAQTSFKEKNLFTSKLDLSLSSKVLRLYNSFCGAETWTIQKVDQIQFESFEMWCWEWREEISWIDGGVKEGRHIVRYNCLL